MNNLAKIREALVDALLKAPDLNLRRVRRRLGLSGRQTRIASRIASRIAKAQRKAQASA
jgi:hypothetical protein